MAFSGGCQCGAIRYEVKGEPAFAAICHCDDCRRSSGTAFATNVFVKADDLAVVKGQTKAFAHPTASGSTMTREFCPDCGSPLFGHSSAGSGMRAVRVGSLDDASFVKPGVEVWTMRKLPFVHLLEDTQHFEKNRPR
jgi:hypothetical protein